MEALFRKVVALIENNKLLFLVLLLAALVRLLFLNSNPPALNWDEVSHGYNAYSILKTGRDEWGSLLPLSNFRAYGDYPLALNLYLTMPFVAIFGLNEFSIRLPHAFLGILTVFATYFLSWGLTKSKNISLLAALLVAIEPWGLFLSRFVVQSNLSVFFLTAALAAFFNREKNRYLLPLSILFLGLTLYSYHTTRIVSPILLILGFFIYRKSIIGVVRSDPMSKRLLTVTLLVLFVPLPFLLSKAESTARSKFTFIVNEGAIAKIIEARDQSQLPETAKRLLYNRPTYFLSKFSVSYVNYFSPKFLFIQGGTQYQLSVPGRGLAYLIDLPFFYLGLYLIIRKAIKREKDSRFLLVWLLVSPIPAAITTEANAVVRATAMLPLPMIITSVGFWEASKWFKERIKLNYVRILSMAYMIVLAIFAGGYLREYFSNYRRDYSWSWQYGYKQAVEYARTNYQRYDKIIVTKKYGEPHEFFLFFWPWDPAKYRLDSNLVRFYQAGWYWVDSFDKFYFINDWQINEEGVAEYTFRLESGGIVDCQPPITSCLLITSPGNYLETWNKLETTNFLDGKPAFEILDNRDVYALQ